MLLNQAALEAMLGNERSAGRGQAVTDRPAAPAEQPERSGDDTRRRGWFWHWNTIITQFSPLIGLKGVGLLNSYTVWTDRREHSPYRGYAFPSQHAEAAFYGEDRAELITINKILVALDLIEIRKEMVTRIDEAGRRWRVPHNFYRVKDRPEGFVLSPEAVLRVVELAARDEAVYRYIRHVFSPRFAPIDRDNVWHQILPVLRRHPLWQQLAARAAAEEARFSARTKAGHARRKAAQSSAPVPTTVAPTDDVPGTVVAPRNSGSPSAVAPSNTASAGSDRTIVGPSNSEEGSDVAPVDSTYDQASATTTTTTVTASTTPPPDAAGPLLEPSADVVACYEAANARPATPLERTLLAELEREFVSLAANRGERPSELVIAAIREAVASGSRYVAPKRVREILSRWARSSVRPGDPSTRSLSHSVPSRGEASVSTEASALDRLLTSPVLDLLVARLEEAVAARLGESARSTDSSAASSPRSPDAVAPTVPGPSPALAALWSLAQEHLSERLPALAFAECVRPARLLAAPAPDELVLGVPSAAIRRQLERRWLAQIREVLSTLLARPVRVRVVAFAEWNSQAAPSP
ncbi:MAG: hypothetical protein RMK01_13105 [Thermomicrobium sp.]|nr:hypothetical protein [Thermomicrobium sp.]